MLSKYVLMYVFMLFLLVEGAALVVVWISAAVAILGGFGLAACLFARLGSSDDESESDEEGGEEGSATGVGKFTIPPATNSAPNFWKTSNTFNFLLYYIYNFNNLYFVFLDCWDFDIFYIYHICTYRGTVVLS